MKDESRDVAIEIFVGLESKVYSFLVDDNSEHKKAKGMNWNVIAVITHIEYKDVLLNNKCLRHWINRIQSQNHRIGTYWIKKKKKFIVLFLWQKIYPKQRIWWISYENIVLIFSLKGKAFLSSYNNFV